MIVKEYGFLSLRASHTPGISIIFFIAGSLAVLVGAVMVLIGLSESSATSAVTAGQGIIILLGSLFLFGFGAAISRLHALNENLSGLIEHVILPKLAKPNEPTSTSVEQ